MKEITNSAIARIKSLTDAGTFVELGSEVKDGVITGYGQIDGKLVYVYSQDSSVIGGSIGKSNSKQIVNIYDMAMKMGAPVIGILDCSGLRLEDSIESLNGLASIYKAQNAASGIIPQIAIVLGSCGGGVSIIPALSDFTFVEKEKASLFLKSADTILGNTKEKCDTSKPEWKSVNTQSVDICDTEENIITGVRNLIDILPENNRYAILPEECNDDLNRLCENIENAADDLNTIISMLADEYMFVETKKETAKEMATGLIRIGGMTVGVVGNREKLLNAAGAKKAADFINYCDAFNIPVLSLVNVNGYASSYDEEILAPAAIASLVHAYSMATVPLVSVVLEESIGSAAAVMGNKALGVDIVYAWTNAKSGVLDGMNTAKILHEGEDKIKEKADKYDEINKTAAVEKGYIDSVIDPSSTRKYLISAFEMLATKQVFNKYKKHSSF